MTNAVPIYHPPPSKKRARRLFAAKAAFGVALLAVIVTRVDMTSLADALRQADPLLCAAGFLLMAAALMFNGLQNQIGFRVHGLEVPLAALLRIQFIALFYGLALPSGISGAAVKWYRLSQGGKYLSETFALMAYCRLISTLVLVALGLLGAFRPGAPGGPTLRFSGGILLAALLLSTLPFLSTHAASFAERIFTPAAAWLPQRLQAFARKFWAAATAFNDLGPRRAAAILACALAHNLLIIASLHGLCRAVQIDIPPLELAWLQVVLYLVQALPISIAGLGVREATLTFLLPELYGYPAAAALAASLLIFGRRLFVGCLGGLAEAYEAFVSPHTEKE